MVLSGIGAAVMFFLNGRRAGKLTALNNRDEEKARILNQGTKAEIDKAAKLQTTIAARNEKAAAIRKKAEDNLHTVAAHDETLADISNRFNSTRPRVRKPTSKPT